MKNDTIPHIIIGCVPEEIRIRKNFFSQQTAFLLLISQVVLQQDILEAKCILTPTHNEIKQVFHESTQFLKQVATG